jgi:hypothetical protein
MKGIEQNDTQNNDVQQTGTQKYDIEQNDTLNNDIRKNGTP